MAGLDLDPWQQWCLRHALGEREDGKWAAFGVGIIVPRQNGKGGLLEARELAGLFLLGERLIIHSAHQFDTSQEAFERLVERIDNTPTLKRRVARNGVSRAHGSEGIRLSNGQRIRFRTRTKGGGRGFTADCLILDEAMILPDAFLQAVLPTLSSRPNPQVWYTGSAVDQDIHEHGLVLARVRERGHAGAQERLFYAEWSSGDTLDEVTEAVATDPEAWAQSNPALGLRISPEYVADERREFASNLRGFAVERLGVGDWPRTDPEPERFIDPEDWMACADPESAVEGDRLCLAFDVSPDRVGSIALAGPRSDGNTHVEILESNHGSRWMVPRLLELVKEYHPVSIVYDTGGPAGSLAQELEKNIREIHQVVPWGARELAQACGLFYEAICDHTVHHRSQDPLDVAVDGAARRTLGEAWAWSRKSSTVDISPLVACTLAYLAAINMPEPVGAWDLNEVWEEMQERKRKEEEDQ